MSKKYIELEAAIMAIEKPKVTPGGGIFDALKKACQEEVRNLPAADVVEVKYCDFNLEDERRRESVYKCSACGNYLTVRANTLNAGRGDLNYCPFCGRKVKHRGINK
jgi:DNA-directed RNA polymerase subunit RPC12/RpoP